MPQHRSKPSDAPTRAVPAVPPSIPPAQAGAGLLSRIRAEYREMPDLRLTAAQAARLWSVAREECESILQGLVAAGDLQRTADGRYVAPGSLRRTSL